MAGSILIAEQRGLAISTVDFDYLTERIRQVLLSQAPATLAKAYQSVDEGGMTFVSLLELDAIEYQSFVSAFEDAWKIAMEDSSFSSRSGLWIELFQILEVDVRYFPKPKPE